MAANPFPGWLAEVADDTVVVCPDDINAEARGNQWSFSLSPEQAAGVTVADVAVFAAGVAEGRRAWLAARGIGSMVLYWWHDTLAGQLRFSLVSQAHGRLPFGCEVVPAASFAAVVSDWLGSPALHGIPWGELLPMASDTAAPELLPTVLPVWSMTLHQTSDDENLIDESDPSNG